MAKSLENILVVAISSRALFDFEEENKIFDDSSGDHSEREERYMQLQKERWEIPAEPSVGFQLCRKLLSMNADGTKRTEVVVISRNDPISGARVFRSAQHHNLALTRGAFVRGDDPFLYLEPFKAKLFLSAKPEDVKKALEMNIPAATVFPRVVGDDPHPNELRIAFDGDSVLFSDQAERVYKEQKLEAFMTHEVQNASLPLPPGPLQPFLSALHSLQNSLPRGAGCRIKTALVTARGAPAHERALKTLLHWGIQVDQALFLDGLEKRPFLDVFQPDFFFDDQLAHINPAMGTTPSGHVPYGIANEAPVSETTTQDKETN